MKATGIIRRVDDLGRVIIPRDIRRTLHIREGDPLEIFTTEEGGVTFQPYRASLARDIRDMKDEVSMTLDCMARAVAVEEIKSYLEKAAKMVEKLEAEN